MALGVFIAVRSFVAAWRLTVDHDQRKRMFALLGLRGAFGVGCRGPQIGRSALEPPPQIFAVYGSDQSINALCFCEAPRVTMLIWIRSQILEERLPPRFGPATVDDAGPSWVDGLATLVANQFCTNAHVRSLPAEACVSRRPFFAATATGNAVHALRARDGRWVRSTELTGVSAGTGRPRLRQGGRSW
jgi:hypothetical protein